jgi:hypothetical protein
MKTYTIQLLKEEAKNLLDQLQKLEIIRFVENKSVKSFDKKFDAFRIDTKGFKFNREEANER